MEENDEEADVKIMDESATFGELVVWGHETLPDDASDPFVRGIEEWIEFILRLLETEYGVRFPRESCKPNW